MEQPTCRNCRFWELVGESRGHGLCRRYAPRAKMGGVETDSDAAGNWPLTRTDDWCGEFQPKAAPPV